MAAEDLNIRLSMPFPHRGVRGQVGHCLQGLWTLNNVHVPLEKGGNQVGREGGRGEGMRVMLSEGLAVTPQTTR